MLFHLITYCQTLEQLSRDHYRYSIHIQFLISNISAHSLIRNDMLQIHKHSDLKCTSEVCIQSNLLRAVELKYYECFMSHFIHLPITYKIDDGGGG